MNIAPNMSTPSVYWPGPATKNPIATARKQSAAIIVPIVDLVRGIMTSFFLCRETRFLFQELLSISPRSKREYFLVNLDRNLSTILVPCISGCLFNSIGPASGLRFSGVRAYDSIYPQ
jgi:hypothetical protein